MSTKKDKLWNYQMGVYDPKDKVVVQTGDRAFELKGVSYPYRTEEFRLIWLAPFLPGCDEYWDINYVKPERE
jgi:hypothetical protein